MCCCLKNIYVDVYFYVLFLNPIKTRTGGLIFDERIGRMTVAG